MAYVRRLPSGKWQATVRDRSGKRHTATDPLKGVVRKWAAEQEAAVARGAFRDPRLGDIKVGAWHDRVSRVRGIEAVTQAKNASLWRTHCKGHWEDWPMSAVARLEAQAWADQLGSTRRARHQGRAVQSGDKDVPVLAPATIRDIVFLMSNLYKLAMREDPPLVISNPFSDLELPEVRPHGVDFLERDEAEALYAAVMLTAGPGMRVYAELGTTVGLRTGEMNGLHGHRVDWLRSQITVVDVMTRLGLREHPKSRKSHRVVPVPAHILEGMSRLMAARPRDSLVFTAPGGGPVTDAHFRNRAWNPAVDAARLCGNPAPGAGQEYRAGACTPLACDDPRHRIRRSRRGSCGTLRHRGWCRTVCRCTTSRRSSATRTTPPRKRYAHLAPGAHGKVRESWARGSDARVTHDAKEGCPS
ncbi:MAG: hypothetical protein ACRDOK_01605 [Streptosporangiaceae bacterium]